MKRLLLLILVLPVVFSTSITSSSPTLIDYVKEGVTNKYIVGSCCAATFLIVSLNNYIKNLKEKGHQKLIEEESHNVKVCLKYNLENCITLDCIKNGGKQHVCFDLIEMLNKLENNDFTRFDALVQMYNGNDWSISYKRFSEYWKQMKKASDYFSKKLETLYEYDRNYSHYSALINKAQYRIKLIEAAIDYSLLKTAPKKIETSINSISSEVNISNNIVL